MDKKKLALMLAASAFVLGSCGEPVDSFDSNSGGDETVSETESIDSTTVDPVTDYWTEDDLALMEEHLGGHILPFYDVAEHGLAYDLWYYPTYDCLILNIDGITTELFEEFLEVQAEVFTDNTALYSGIDEGMHILDAEFDDYWAIQERVAIYDPVLGIDPISGEGLTGNLQALFIADEPYDAWPEEKIGTYMGYYLKDQTDLREVPAPSDELAEGLIFTVELFNTYDASYNIVPLIEVVAHGDFTAYGADLIAGGYTLAENIPVWDGYDTYISEDETVYVLLSGLEDGVTYIDIYGNPGYYLNWPEGKIGDLVAELTGIEGLTALPAITGADDIGVFNYVDSLESFYIYAFGENIVDSYVAALLEAGFDYGVFYSYEWYYADPDAAFLVNVYYSSSSGATVIYVRLVMSGYAVAWPVETMAEYLSTYGAAEGTTIPEPTNWSYGRIYTLGSRWNLDIYYHVDGSSSSTSILEEYTEQLNASADWTYSESEGGWLDPSGNCLLTLEDYWGATSLYIGRSSTNTSSSSNLTLFDGYNGYIY